jgi:hypothetical protein
VTREPGQTGPGTLTSLIEQVVKGAAPVQAEGSWTDGMRSGTVIGRYELLREVGRGGFGVVWEARDRDLGRTVAFKALRGRGEAAREKRLLAEAEVAARLSHPNIVTVLDVGRSDQGVYLVQEYLTGQPLSRRLETVALPLREALHIGVELARGLAHAHAHGVVHRDLKPENVQLCEDGQVKLLDLGMAAALGRKKLEGGTPSFMAPEQADGAPEDERTDVYALGVLLYRMLTGVAPVEVDPLGRPRSISRGLEVAAAPALGLLVESMLARSPTDRPRDAGAVLEALAEIEAGLPREAGKTGLAARVRRGPRVRWAMAGVAAGMLVAVALGVPAALWWHGPLGARGEAVALAASSSLVLCNWSRLVTQTEFDRPVPNMRWRNGDFQEQKAVMHEGRGAWLQGSDWNQAFLPAQRPGPADRPDVFAVEAHFFAPPSAEHQVSATLHAYGDPIGPMDYTSSDVRHGIGIGLAETPQGVVTFELAIEGLNTHQSMKRGTLPARISGRWHHLRIEGSRSRCWLRALLDGAPLVVLVGYCDFGGADMMLGGGGGSYQAGNVLWREFRVWEGEAGCQ